MDFGDDVMDGGSDAQRRKKRYHRHTPRQIQQLEAYVHPASPADLLFYWLVVSVRVAEIFVLMVGWWPRRTRGERNNQKNNWSDF